MPLPDYRHVLDLFRQGETAAAEKEFIAQHALSQTRRRAAAPHDPRRVLATAELGRHSAADGSACYRIENGRKVGPFCRVCYGRAARLRKLQACDATTYLCRVCQTTYARNLCG